MPWALLFQPQGVDRVFSHSCKVPHGLAPARTSQWGKVSKPSQPVTRAPNTRSCPWPAPATCQRADTTLVGRSITMLLLCCLIRSTSTLVCFSNPSAGISSPRPIWTAGAGPICDILSTAKRKFLHIFFRCGNKTRQVSRSLFHSPWERRSGAAEELGSCYLFIFNLHHKHRRRTFLLPRRFPLVILSWPGGGKKGDFSKLRPRHI